MISTIWFWLVRVFAGLFRAPEYTKLERELIKENEWLKAELAGYQERYAELVFARSNMGLQTPTVSGDLQPLRTSNRVPWATYRARLEANSRKQMKDRAADANDLLVSGLEQETGVAHESQEHEGN
jgi:hypothetical protein